MSLSNNIIAALKRLATVPVYVGERQTIDTDSILISPGKLDDLVGVYESLYAFTHTIWRNLPDPPDCERVYVIMWMISAENYDVNHFSVPWQNTSPNTYMHLWSAIDRFRTMIDTSSAFWLIGSRGPVGYAEFMNLPGAADTHLYPREEVMPPHIGVLSSNMQRCVVTELHTDYPSSYDFKRSMMVRKNAPVIDVSSMHARNIRIMRERMERKTRTGGSVSTP
ncbi:hypothetical protein AYL99_11815 [Fonsecaea erecta]|uniref:Uncharacterized protein n=1 Tax=Fonsecaea erecta TaxID=1367422 RepID=A0A178Z4A7_9EURO|nr:hypothetical protein AYL99_11815 [Fonsecaea erecta]OAP53935.1 hypothetical protein AYL99_11815 [Fonsecaea erecta]